VTPALHFETSDFEEAYDLHSTYLPPSFVLVNYYTSLVEAKTIIKGEGLPALKLNESIAAVTIQPPVTMTMKIQGFEIKAGQRGGVVVSLKAPHQLTSSESAALKFMNPYALEKEAVVCLALPSSLLWSLELVRDDMKQKQHKAPPVPFGSCRDGIRAMSEEHGFDDDENEEEHDEHGEQEEEEVKLSKEIMDVSHLRLLPVEILESVAKVNFFVKARQSVGLIDALTESNASHTVSSSRITQECRCLTLVM
jgi:hypothetical protein